MLAEAMTFLGIVVVLTVTPGADMALVMRHVLEHGLRGAWPTIAGVLSGLVVHVTLCVAGLSVVLRQSDVAFTTVKLAGAAWLAWMGISALWAALRSRGSEQADEEAIARRAGPLPARRLYLRGLLTNVLNVKIALFYIAFLPQFAPAGPSFVPVALGLAAIQAAIGLGWLATYALAIARAGDRLAASPRFRRWLEGSTGAALIGFGARLAAAVR